MGGDIQKFDIMHLGASSIFANLEINLTPHLGVNRRIAETGNEESTQITPHARPRVNRAAVSREYSN